MSDLAAAEWHFRSLWRLAGLEGKWDGASTTCKVIHVDLWDQLAIATKEIERIKASPWPWPKGAGSAS